MLVKYSRGPFGAALVACISHVAVPSARRRRFALVFFALFILLILQSRVQLGDVAGARWQQRVVVETTAVEGEKNMTREQPVVVAGTAVVDGEKSVSRQKARVLVYVTTHMSPLHMEYLNNCWEAMIAKIPLFQKVDIMFHTPVAPSPALLKRIFPTQNVEIHQEKNLGYQEGAMRSMIAAYENDWFEGYEWVIRMNPDILILNDTFIWDNVLDDNVDGIFTDCEEKLMCRPYCSVAYREKAKEFRGVNFKAHSDFFVVRPEAVNKALITKEARNAEYQFTDAIRHISDQGRDRWLNGLKGIANGGQCRIRGPTSPVQHDHRTIDHCPQIFEDPASVLQELFGAAWQASEDLLQNQNQKRMRKKKRKRERKRVGLLGKKIIPN